MALEAGAETLLACGIGGKKHVRDGVFTHHAPTKMCENSTAFEISLVREMTRTVAPPSKQAHCMCPRTRLATGDVAARITPDPSNGVESSQQTPSFFADRYIRTGSWIPPYDSLAPTTSEPGACQASTRNTPACSGSEQCFPSVYFQQSKGMSPV